MSYNVPGYRVNSSTGVAFVNQIQLNARLIMTRRPPIAFVHLIWKLQRVEQLLFARVWEIEECEFWALYTVLSYIIYCVQDLRPSNP